MTTITAPTSVPRVAGPVRPTQARAGLAGWWRDSRILTRRNLVHVRREPMQLSDVTIQPVLFVFLFVYVFGSATTIPGGTYADFVLAGLLTLNLTTASMGTAVGMSNDLKTGVIDRFRTLPMSAGSVLFGRSASDLLSACLAAVLVGLSGLVVGWRPEDGALSMLAGFGLVLLFAYSLSWAAACLGMVAGDPESAQGIGFIVFFPLSFVSNAFVPTQGMPGWLEAVANWNPVSAVTAACRELFGNPNPSSTIDAWPMQHPVQAALAWSLLLLAIFVPLATYLYRTKTTD
jgi:ABC transporter DrrB family efflux protein